MSTASTLSLDFTQADLLDALERSDDPALDAVDMGVIGFDADALVRRYNAFESRLAGLSPQRVVGHPLFTLVAPCMNNFLVAQRFEDAAAAGAALDVTLDYVFTLRMRPAKVTLRLLSQPGRPLRYVIVRRRS